MYEIGKVLHAGISVNDMEESIDWYRRVLGFQLVKDDGFVPFLEARICFMERNGFQLELFQYRDPIPLPEDRKLPNTDLRTIGTKHIAFSVTGMAELRKHLMENDVRIVHETCMNGDSVMFIQDCSGVLIELIETTEH